MTIAPSYSLARAPRPKVVVIPAQSDPVMPCSPGSGWSRARRRDKCRFALGAFCLARTGLVAASLSRPIHSAYAELAMAFPDIQVRRGARFVESGNLASAGGLFLRYRPRTAR